MVATGACSQTGSCPAPCSEDKPTAAVVVTGSDWQLAAGSTTRSTSATDTTSRPAVGRRAHQAEWLFTASMTVAIGTACVTGAVALPAVPQRAQRCFYAV